MEKHNAFPYYWFIDDKEQEITSIRIFAIDENNQNICIKVEDFTPWVYLELPDHIQWTASKAQLLGNKLDELLGKHKPLKKSLIMKHKLYGAHIDSSGNKKKFPYLFCSFSNRGDVRSLGYALRKRIAVVGVGTISIKMHEQDADPILQLVSCRDIPTAGCVTFHGKPVPEIEKITFCHKEYNVKFKNLFNCSDKHSVAKPKIMGFDIEVNSTNPSAMPKAEKPGDKIFQISCVFAREGCKPDEYDPYILTLGEPDPDYLGDNVTIYMYETESDLLKGFTELINTENPNIISGYNILGFDIPYMIDRAKLNLCIGEFDRMGFHKYNHAKERTIKWSSSAYKDQEFQFLDAEGRIFVDLLPLIKRDFKMDNYRLKTISEYFIGDTKDDLSVKGIFKCYRIGTKKELDGTYSKKAQKAMAVCAKYCIQDSVLVIKLMEKLQTWVGLCEMAKTCNTSIFSLYTQGQQIKVFSQVYKHCLKHNIVVEKDGYIAKEDERYVGAHVFPPVPGVYDRVLPFDFCFTGDTLVTMSNGTSRRIDSLERDELVLGYNKEGGFQNYSTINGLQRKGLRETIKIYLQDGRSISCTPEHKFMLSNGEWCEAKNLKGKEVMSGIEYPEDIKCPMENNWKLKVDGYEFNMKNEKEREKSLAFARIVGYILSDGSIYESNIVGKVCIFCNKNFLSDGLLKIHQNETLKCKIKQIEFKNLSDDEIKTKHANKNRIKSNIRPDKRFKENRPIERPKNKKSIYQMFSKIEYKKIKDEIPHLKNTEIFIEIGKRWKNNKNKLKKYNICLDEDETRYKNEMKIYKNKKEKINKIIKYNNIKKPLNIYKIYYKEESKNIKIKNPNLSNKEIVKLSYNLWNEIKKNPEQFNKYKILSDNEKIRYKKEINEYEPNKIIEPQNTKRLNSEACFGTLIDANNFKNDIMKFSDIDITIRKRIGNDGSDRGIKGTTYCLAVPSVLSKMIHSLDNIVVGKRSTQSMKLPDFIIEDNCPLPIIKEFLSGLYGGDGTTVCLSKKFSGLSFEWTTTEKYLNDMKNVFKNLENLHKKLGIETQIYEPTFVKYSEYSKMIPKDIEENPRFKVKLSVKLKEIINFSEKLCFKYCVNKQNRLIIAKSYVNYNNNIISQYNLISNKIKELLKNKNLTYYECFIKAKNEEKSYFLNDKILEFLSLKNSKLKKNLLPTINEYLKQTNTTEWFNKKSYSVKQDDIYIPSYKNLIIHIENNGLQNVYDIEVEDVHNFLVYGIVTKNCSLYPTT